ncbi:CDP-alcohol phosphatidyltransferase family protein [bacterium]
MTARVDEETKTIDMTRVNHTLLGVIEKKVLLFLASKTPAWIGPNGLTFIGFLGAVFALIGYWLSSYNHNYLWLACFGWLANWYGDSLDGTLARYRKIEKPQFGFYIDHNCDALSVFVFGVGFGLSPYVRLDVSMLLLIAYLLMSIQTYVYTCSTGIFQISYTKLGATEFRLMVILITVGLYFFKFPVMTLFNQILSVMDILLLIPFTIMMILYIMTILKNGVRLYRAENNK